MQKINFNNEIYLKCGVGAMPSTKRFATTSGKFIDVHLAKVQSADRERIYAFDRDNSQLNLISAPQSQHQPFVVGDLVLLYPIRSNKPNTFYALRAVPYGKSKPVTPTAPVFRPQPQRLKGTIIQVNGPKIRLQCARGEYWQIHQSEMLGIPLRVGTPVVFKPVPGATGIAHQALLLIN